MNIYRSDKDIENEFNALVRHCRIGKVTAKHPRVWVPDYKPWWRDAPWWRSSEPFDWRDVPDCYIPPIIPPHGVMM